MNQKFKYFRDSVKLVWRSAPGWTLTNIIISVLQSALPLLLIWLIKSVIDEIINAASAQSGNNFTLLLWPVIAVVLVWFFDEAATDIGSFVRKKQSVRLESYMYGLLHEKAIKLDLIYFERPGYFDILTRASREAPWRPNSILNNLISLSRGILSLILMAGLLTFLHWSVALLLLVVNIPGIWLRLHYAGVLYNFRKEQTPEARKTAYFNWLLTGDRPSREIRLFGLGNYFISLFRKSFRKTKEDEIGIVRKRTFIELISDLVKAAAVLVTLLYVSRETINGALTLGMMAMFLLAFRQGMTAIKELFGSLAGLYEDCLFISDTFEFLNLQENIKGTPPVTDVSTFGSSLKAENLCFTYPGNKEKCIDNFGFEIKKGEIIAIAGPNGAGKSTLVRLLCRLYDPDSGNILLDGTNIRHFDPESYRKLFSVVFQDFMLYNMEAGENIRLGNIDEKDHEKKIISAAEKTGLGTLLNSLPKGYSTVIGTLFDDSRELSWGEWQKIALARALFRDAPILILDEPSSALDADTEYEIFRRFRELASGRTSILISHRFTNVSLADRIIVLDKGRIAESGTHEELMNKKGMYFSMYTKQNSRFDK